MKQVTVRELQQNIRSVLERVQAGEVIEVTRRRKAVARITPTSDADEPADWPDLAARTKSVFGSRKLDPAPSEQIAVDRGRW
jgi:prevent-host-death family protein